MVVYYATFAGMLEYVQRCVRYWIALVFLFLFARFRYQLGCDWYNNLRNWTLAQNTSLSEALTRRRLRGHQAASGPRS